METYFKDYSNKETVKSIRDMYHKLAQRSLTFILFMPVHFLYANAPAFVTVRAAYLIQLDSTDTAMIEDQITDIWNIHNRIDIYLLDDVATESLKRFKPHSVAFLGYLISHESHHRGQIVLSLKQAGFPVSRKVAYGIWEWGTK